MDQAPAETQPSPLSSYLELHKAADGSELIRSHDAAVEYYSGFNDNRELYHDFVKGNHWDEEELQVLKDKNKAAISFNKLKVYQRTFLGAIIQQRFDIKPAPMDPGDQDASDALTVLYHWTAHSTQVKMKDPLLVNEAWIGGNAWQESMVEVAPGKRPVIRVYNMNPFSVYPDPNSRDLVERKDCRFIDRVTWPSITDLCELFPDKADEIKRRLSDTIKGNTFDKDKRYADRAHEWKNSRNGKFKVVERLYKATKTFHFGATEDGDRMDIGWDAEPDALNSFKEDYPEHRLHRQREDFFFLAIVCPAFGDEFLENEEYHCQPKDPVTEELMWPWVELIDEELDGEPSGHVEHEVGPLKVLNSMMVNKLHQAKHAAGQVHIISADHFDEDTIEDVAENIAEGSRSVIKKSGAPPGSGVELAPLAQMGKDGNESIEFVSAFCDEASSTTPAMQGIAGNSGESGKLNEQRTQQSYIQSAWSNNNYQHFVTKRGKLWVYYFQQYFPFEMTVRVMEKKSPQDPSHITINQTVDDGYGGVRKVNDINALRYDIVFEDSWQSPTVKDKVRQQITQLMGMSGVQLDPTLSAFLTLYFLKLSDAPQDLKDFVQEHSQVIKAQEMQKQEMEAQTTAMGNTQQLQQMADAEAQATAAPDFQPARPANNLQPAAMPA